MLSVIAMAAALSAVDVDTELKAHDIELDAGSYLHHWDRSEEWNEGFDNNYIGVQYYTDQPNIFIKGAVFENSFGNNGGVLGGGFYFDDSGRFKQGLELGLTWGYERDQGNDIFAGYTARVDVTNIIKLKLHANPIFGGVILTFDL